MQDQGVNGTQSDVRLNSKADLRSIMDKILSFNAFLFARRSLRHQCLIRTCG